MKIILSIALCLCMGISDTYPQPNHGRGHGYHRGGDHAHRGGYGYDGVILADPYIVDPFDAPYPYYHRYYRDGFNTYWTVR